MVRSFRFSEKGFNHLWYLFGFNDPSSLEISQVLPFKYCLHNELASPHSISWKQRWQLASTTLPAYLNPPDKFSILLVFPERFPLSPWTLQLLWTTSCFPLDISAILSRFLILSFHRCLVQHGSKGRLWKCDGRMRCWWQDIPQT